MQDTIIGKKIKNLRNLRGMSQMQLAERINLSYQQVQKYESGRSEITLKRLYQIARVLEVPIYDFLEEKNESKAAESSAEYNTDNRIIFKLNKEEAAVLKLYRRIKNRKIKEGLLKQLKGIIELVEGKKEYQISRYIQDKDHE